MTSIGNYAFSDTAVEKFEIGSGVESVNGNVFEGNNALKEIVFDNSQDNVTITGTLPDAVKVTYTQQSIPDDVGDTISGASGALTLQEAVNEAAKTGNSGQITLEKNIKIESSSYCSGGADGYDHRRARNIKIAGTKTATDLKKSFRSGEWRFISY